MDAGDSEKGKGISGERMTQACLRPRDRFWDIPVPKIDSAFDNLFVPQPSWSPSTTQQLRKLVAAPYLAPNDWTPRSEAYFVFPLAQGTPGKQCGLAATGVYQPSLRSPWLAAKENDIEQRLLTKLQDLKYTYRPDIRDREALEQNFREKFEALNRVNLTDAEFSRLLEGIISPDTFACAETLRHRNTFEREDGTPLHYQPVNLKDWCKNSFEVVSQLRINTKSSFQRYDVILLLNGLPLV
ncbi:type I restriction endonuclease, partial [Thiolapillus sp.]